MDYSRAWQQAGTRLPRSLDGCHVSNTGVELIKLTGVERPKAKTGHFVTPQLNCGDAV
jgi:hypothetical protein